MKHNHESHEQHHHQADVVPKMMRYSRDRLPIAAVSVVGAAVGAILQEYRNNKSFYKDLVKFNFCNGKKKQHREREMRIGNLPAEVNAQLNKLRSSLGYSEDQLFKVLNVPRDIQNSHSCLRTKWLFEYYSIYGTLGWVPGRSVPNYKIKQKLSAEESSSCRDLLL